MWCSSTPKYEGEWYVQRAFPRAPRGATCARLAFDSATSFHAVFTLFERLQVEACGEIDRASPLETPEVLVARVYATSVDVQVFVETLPYSGFDDRASALCFSFLCSARTTRRTCRSTRASSLPLC